MTPAPETLMRLRLMMLGCLALAAGCGRGPGPASPGRPGNMRAPRLGHTMTRLADGRVLVAGGIADAKSLLSPANTDVELYDAATGRFTVVATMETVRAMHTATLLADGRMVFIGGSPGTAVDIYNPSTRAIEPGGNLLGQRGIHTATLLADGRILLVGGMKESVTYAAGLFHEEPRYLTSIELYDPKTKSSRAFAAELRVPRRGHTATLLDDGRVLVVGGTWVPRTEIIDPARGAVAWGPNLNVAREDHRATRLADGRILITGGSDPSGKSLATAEVFSPRENRFRLLAARMNRAREDHTADLLADGRVLITGGEDNAAGPDKRDIVLDDVEIFDPSGSASGQPPRAESFAKLPSLSEPRDDHGSALLPGGGVLITGGENADDLGSRTAEIIVAPPPPARN